MIQNIKNIRNNNVLEYPCLRHIRRGLNCSFLRQGLVKVFY